MSDLAKAYVGAQIHDGRALLEGHALGVSTAGLVGVLPVVSLPKECPVEQLDGGLITPGFVDLQVNGGGGVMFNDAPDVETLVRIAEAHRGCGTEAILPTLITDTPDQTRAAIDAVAAAIAEKVPGITGIHLEGPHLSVARKGAHEAALIRPMEQSDLALLLSAAERIPNVMVTVAPESTTPAQIRTLSDAGALVSLGHTDADHATCHAAFDAGAHMVTHLFNAMSQLGSREPGLVGATLEREEVFAGLIADGHHVHPATIRLALAAKAPADQVFLVSDAMATAGSDITEFSLNGRRVYRKDHRLTLADGTLAGADLDLRRALGVMTDEVGEDIATALPRACATPAGLLRERQGLGRIDGAGRSALYLPDGLSMQSAPRWINS